MKTGLKTGLQTGLNQRLNPSQRSSSANEFEDALRRRIVGQEEAVLQTVQLYQMYLAGLNPTGRPIGNLLFLGPTGVGKTATVEAIAEALFGSTRACIKVDCAEFQHAHEIAKLVGSPPGYLGHRETHPTFTQEALNQWHTETQKLCVVLFDEIEKASCALWQLLLGILDKATLTLGDNRKVDFSQCIIVMTSNLGARDMACLQGAGMGFQGTLAEQVDDVFDEKINRTAVEAARRHFSPEFMNRIDRTVVFKTLRPEHLAEILEIELGQVQYRILMTSPERAFVFSCSPKMKGFLLQEGCDPKYGARHLKRKIEMHVVHTLASLSASGQIKSGDFVCIDREEEETTFTKQAENALSSVLNLPCCKGLQKKRGPSVPAPDPQPEEQELKPEEPA